MRLFTYKPKGGEQTRWKKEKDTYAPTNDEARRYFALSTAPLKSEQDVRGLVNRHNDADPEKQRDTTGRGSLTIRSVLREQAGLSGPELDRWTAIAIAESGGNARAKHKNFDGSTDRGLFQINSIHGGEKATDQMFVLTKNIIAAKEISNNWQNPLPWATYTSGKYRNYLGKDRKITNTGNDTGGGNTDPLLKDIGDTAVETANDVGSGINALANAVDDVVGALFDPSTYLRLGKGGLGAVAIVLGAWALFATYQKSGSTPAIPVGIKPPIPKA